MNVNNVKDAILAAKSEVLPNLTIVFSQGVLDCNALSVFVHLGKDINEMPNGIVMNDPLSVRFYIEAVSDDLYNVESTLMIGRLKPESKLYAQSSEKIRTRKFTGNSDKVQANMKKMFVKLRTKIIELNDSNKFLPGLAYNISDKI